MSRMPWRGAEKTSTSPGAVKPAGIITTTPWTFGNRRSASRSFATPFCTQKIGWPSTPASRSRPSAASVSWDFMASRIASSGRKPSSEGSPTQGNRARALPAGVRMTSPPDRIAASRSPRAIPTTSCPASASAAASAPPIAPTP